MANLFTNQDAFDNAAWLKIGFAEVTADQTTAPDGTDTADKLGDDNSPESTGGVTILQIVTVTNAVHVLSVCAKADQLNFVRLFTSNFDVDANDESYFNLSTGALVSKGTNHIAAGISAVTNGWYQCWVTFQSTTDLTGNAGYGLSEDGLDSDVDIDGTSSIFLWRGQMELGSTPTACAEAAATPMLGGGRVLVKGQMPKWWKEYEETQPQEPGPKVIAPKDRIAALAGRLRMPKK